MIDPIWECEPDSKDWEEFGLPCALRRNGSGAWCGYVGVKYPHPAFDTPYSDLDLDAHGGLTYGEHMREPNGRLPVEFYWLGFDCAHLYDLCPNDYRSGFWQLLDPDAEYRDIHYATAETSRLAEQLAAMTNQPKECDDAEFD